MVGKQIMPQPQSVISVFLPPAEVLELWRPVFGLFANVYGIRSIRTPYLLVLEIFVASSSSRYVQYWTKSLNVKTRYHTQRDFSTIILSTTMAQRTPLAPCDGNRSINKELKPTIRAQISMGRAVGLIYKQIGALTFLTPATVSITL
jgi:hypothetical protein